MGLAGTDVIFKLTTIDKLDDVKNLKPAPLGLTNIHKVFQELLFWMWVKYVGQIICIVT